MEYFENLFRAAAHADSEKGIDRRVCEISVLFCFALFQLLYNL